MISDPDAGQSGFVAQSAVPGTYGSFSLTSSGAWSYSLNNAAANVQALPATASVTDSFTITTADGTTRTVIVTVNGTNDAPLAVGAAFSVAEDAPVVTGSVSATDVDANAVLSFALNGAPPAGLSFNPNGTYSFDPSNAAYQSLGAGQSRLLTVPFTVTDDQGATSTRNLLITVTGTNDAPVNSLPSTQATSEDSAWVFSSANGNAITVSDVDSASLTTTLVVTHGSLTLGSTTSVTFTGNDTGTLQITGTAAAINAALEGASFKPANDFSGSSTLSVTTNDGAASDVDIVAIGVTAVADAPTLYAHISAPAVAAGATLFSDTFNDGNFTTPEWTRVKLLQNTFTADPTSTKGQTEAQLFNNVAWQGQTTDTEWKNAWTVAGGQVRYNAGGAGGSDDAQGMLAYTGLSAIDRARTSYAVSMDMSANPSSEQNNGGGIVFGYQDANNYFLARWENPGTGYQPGGSLHNQYPGQANQLSLVQMVGGAPVDLGVFANFSTVSSFNLRVEVSGLGIQVFADDTGAVYNGITPLISYAYGAVAGGASTPPVLNTLGLYTFDNDAGVSFDNVQVKGLNYTYALDLQATLNDTDGSESLSAITLSGLPACVTLAGAGGAISVVAGTATVPTTSGADTLLTVSSSTPLTGAEIHAIQGAVTATDTGAVTATATVHVMQELLGTASANALTGTANGDWIDGRAGNDTLNGGNGNDVLLGGPGSDILTGGAGTDVFKWALADRGAPGSPPTDTVTDFVNAPGGDQLDLRDLLVGENSGNLSNYLHFTTAGGSTTIQISSTGGFSAGFSGGAVDQVVQLTGVNLVGAFTTDTQVINDLLNRGKLITDGA